MKATTIKNWLAVSAAVVMATTVFPVAADQPASAVRPEENYTGTVVSVDTKESTLETKGVLLRKKFNLGSACSYTLLDKGAATASDLRPGQKITVRYRDVDGVLVADRVEQLAMQFDGKVTAIDAGTHTVTLHRPGLDKQMQIADDCKIVLRDEKPGTLADIHPGNHVTVIYEKPAAGPVARRIAQTSLEFTGALTAIDLNERTIKAKAMFDTKKFNLADNCTIIVGGRLDGRLSDLKPNDTLVFSYDEINGVNVANRIAPAKTAATNSVTTATAGGS